MSKIKELDLQIESLLNKARELNGEEVEKLFSLSSQLDAELSKVDEEPELPSNVHYLDQNKRKRVLINKKYQNNAKVIPFFTEKLNGDKTNV